MVRGRRKDEHLPGCSVVALTQCPRPARGPPRGRLLALCVFGVRGPGCLPSSPRPGVSPAWHPRVGAGDWEGPADRIKHSQMSTTSPCLSISFWKWAFVLSSICAFRCILKHLINIWLPVSKCSVFLLVSLMERGRDIFTLTPWEPMHQGAAWESWTPTPRLPRRPVHG